MQEVKYSVSEFNAVCNQTLEHAFSTVVVEGEVASFKVNQGKFVFFDLKDEECSVGCFMMVYALRFAIEDGMKVVVKATPKLTTWGKFSLTILEIMPVGEGALKKNFELLKKKLAGEGLFDEQRKRPLPDGLTKIGVISSTQAAGYVDFCKILNERWGGLSVLTAHVQVQGMGAADQIIKALKYFNERTEVEVVAIVRGGGSTDDLAIFNDEALVREVAASRILVITGIGHEVDESLVDLAADVVASTPTNAAQMLTGDRKAEIARGWDYVERVKNVLKERVESTEREIGGIIGKMGVNIVVKITTFEEKVKGQLAILEELNPEKVLERGYALIKGEVDIGNVVNITTLDKEIKAEVKNVTKRAN
ncbi:exodeoxyribonuclease VII large subunit [Candidatus Saccharibacteria bacterium]|nr:exodeoxyribonuclease VII large subunit [Candidatus Saccharibacteria bacterium]